MKEKILCVRSIVKTRCGGFVVEYCIDKAYPDVIEVYFKNIKDLCDWLSSEFDYEISY